MTTNQIRYQELLATKARDAVNAQVSLGTLEESKRHNQTVEGETNRHNLVVESQALKELGIQQQNADANSRNAETNYLNYTVNQQNAETNKRNADTNAYNAETNRLNYQVNQQNAMTNAYNAQTNRLNYGVNLQNAETNRMNAKVNAYNAETNRYNAETNRLNYGVNLMNAELYHDKILNDWYLGNRQLAENARHNRAVEQENKRHNLEWEEQQWAGLDIDDRRQDTNESSNLREWIHTGIDIAGDLLKDLGPLFK